MVSATPVSSKVIRLEDILPEAFRSESWLCGIISAMDASCATQFHNIEARRYRNTPSDGILNIVGATSTDPSESTYFCVKLESQDISPEPFDCVKDTKAFSEWLTLPPEDAAQQSWILWHTEQL